MPKDPSMEVEADPGTEEDEDPSMRDLVPSRLVGASCIPDRPPPGVVLGTFPR
jgi:hypothetical protein